MGIKRKYFMSVCGEKFYYFETEQESIDAANKAIDSCRDEFWDDSVEDIFIGVITQVTEKTDIRLRPANDIDDQDDEYWPYGMDYKCDYELTKLKD